jgi:hypothetical protein
MSEIKLNLVDSHTILVGTIHGSTADRCVAALSAEPETIGELEAALERFEKDPPRFRSWFHSTSEIDEDPYDAGILVIDLAARVVACESTYSLPGPTGYVRYHDGKCATDVSVSYRVPDDWVFLRSIEKYSCTRKQQLAKRLGSPAIDTRTILYGRPMLEFLAMNVRYASVCRGVEVEESKPGADAPGLSAVSAVHAQWLSTPREDLGGMSPREVMLTKREFIDCDLDSRETQWSFQLEGPPGLTRESFAYRLAGFGTNEWVIYYYLIRFLLESASTFADEDFSDFEELVTQLETLKNKWLNEPNPELGGHTPAIAIDNERRRLPEAMGGRSMVIDEDCPLCKMMGDEAEAGLGVWFWHLDGCNMDDHFAFSTFLTEKEYLEDRLEMELRHQEFDRRWKEREERIARGEPVEPDPFFDPPVLEDFAPFALSEAEPPEA